MAPERQTSPKLELKLNEEAHVKLLKDKCYEGTSAYGTYYLYSVEHNGAEKSFFAPAEIHAQISAHGLRAGSEFILRKVASQNGKKITGELIFEATNNQPATGPAVKSNGLSDGFGQIMQQSLEEAIEIAKTVPGIDSQRIGMTLFIARTKSNGLH